MLSIFRRTTYSYFNISSIYDIIRIFAVVNTNTSWKLNYNLLKLKEFLYSRKKKYNIKNILKFICNKIVLSNKIKTFYSSTDIHRLSRYDFTSPIHNPMRTILTINKFFTISCLYYFNYILPHYKYFFFKQQ